MIEARTLYDVCIIGSGPAGLASARVLANKGHSVLIIERGGQSLADTDMSIANAEMVTPESHSDMEFAVGACLGGTSSLWGGRNVPFDSVDFASRDFVEHSQWPFDLKELDDYREPAGQFLNIDNANFTIKTCQQTEHQNKPLSEHFQDSDVLKATDLERWSQQTHIWEAHKQTYIEHENITILTDTVCCGFTQDAENNTVQNIKVKKTHQSDGTSAYESIQAKEIIIAAGGVESTKLILNSMKEQDGLKVQSDLVGKYYMGHPSGKIASIILNGDPDDTIYDFEQDGLTYIRRRMTLSQQTLIDNKVLNIAFWLDNPSLSDPAHGSGILSSAYLALKTPFLGRKLAPQAIINRLTTSDVVQPKSKHILNCIFDIIPTAKFAINFIYKRYLSSNKLPGFFIKSKNNKYALHYHAEQAPNKKSQITLSEQMDPFGFNKAKIELRWSEQDIQSIIKAHAILDDNLRANNIGYLEYSYSDAEIEKQIKDQAIDGFHQLGTLKMGTNPNDAVTDAQGRIFGCPNVYVASSATFPSSGQANPTFLIVMLALRQAEHIHEKLSGEGVQ